MVGRQLRGSDGCVSFQASLQFWWFSFCKHLYSSHHCPCVCILRHLSHVGLFAIWAVALQAPLCMGFSRQDYWSGFPCPPPGDLPSPGIEPASLTSPSLAGRFFTVCITWETLSPHWGLKPRYSSSITFLPAGGPTHPTTASLWPPICLFFWSPFPTSPHSWPSCASWGGSLLLSASFADLPSLLTSFLLCPCLPAGCCWSLGQDSCSCSRTLAQGECPASPKLHCVPTVLGANSKAWRSIGLHICMHLQDDLCKAQFPLSLLSFV